MAKRRIGRSSGEVKLKKTKRCVGQLLLSAKWNLRFMLKRENTRIITWNQNDFAPQASSFGRAGNRVDGQREKNWHQQAATPTDDYYSAAVVCVVANFALLFHLLTEFSCSIILCVRTTQRNHQQKDEAREKTATKIIIYSSCVRAYHFFSSSLSFFHTRAHFGVRSILRVRLNCFKWSFNLVFCWERERPKYSNINICVIPTWRSQIWKWLHHFVRDTILRAFTHTHTLEPTINTKRSAAISERWEKNEEKNVFRYWRAAIGMISFLVDVVAVILWIRKSVGTIFVRPAKLAVFRIRIFLLYNT